MKIYRNDGTWYQNKISDDSFGWNLKDVPSKIPKERNKKNPQPNSIINTNIKIQNATSAINFDLLCLEDIYEDIDQKVPRKSQILNLINPCTIESKILLCVVRYSMYKQFNAEMIKIDDLQNGANFRHIDGTENAIFDGILNYYHYKNNDVLPFLMELILSDNRCDVNEIATEDKTDYSRNNLSDEKKGTEEEKEKFHENRKRKNLEIFKNSEYYQKILQIKNSFQEEIIRVDNLIKTAQIMEGDFRATKFLEDLINLLNGALDKINLKISPFRVLNKLCEQQDQNLIV